MLVVDPGQPLRIEHPGSSLSSLKHVLMNHFAKTLENLESQVGYLTLVEFSPPTPRTTVSSAVEGIAMRDPTEEGIRQWCGHTVCEKR